MMNVLIIALAVIGLLFLILLAIGAFSAKVPTSPPPTEDPAAPYREGLHAAVRMQRVAQDLEQQIYAEEAKHMQADRGQPSAKEEL